MRHDRVDAPWVFDGPIDAEVFRTYVEQVLVPTLHPGDIVNLDNLGSHETPEIRTHPGRRRKALVPATLQPGPEPNRTGLWQTQTPAPQGRRTIQGNPLETQRRPALPLQSQGMRKLPRQPRICFRENLKCSRRAGYLDTF